MTVFHCVNIGQVARIVHPFGLRPSSGPSLPHVIGTAATLLVSVIAAIVAITRFLSGASPGT